jgi:hypothetical protein
VLHLPQAAVDSDLPHKMGSLCFGVREQLSKDDEMRVDLTSLPNHVPSEVDGSAMQVVQPETIEILGHFSDIGCHVVPGDGGV